MFLRRVLSLAGLKTGRKIVENDVLSAYNTVYNKVEVTEFYYKSDTSFRAAALLHEVKHLNILRTIKIEPRSRKIVTEQIQPFSSIFSVKDREFNKHCAYSLASAIAFLHDKCKVAHNNISFDALFITNSLNFVLGSFERSSKEQGFQKDIDGFQKVLSAFSLPRRLIADVVKDRAWYSDFLCGMEAFMHEFSALKLHEKEKRVRDIENNLKVLNPFFRKKVSEKLTAELRILKEKTSSSDDRTRLYKEAIAKMALELDPCKENVLNELFTILDPALRVFLLKNVEASKASLLDDRAMECMLVGIRCKDYEIQTLTICFISQGYGGLSIKQKEMFIRSARLLENRAMLGEVCMILLRHVDLTPRVNKEVCKLIELFLPVEEMCLEVLPLVKIYYKGFSYAEICRNIAVVLLELVRHQESQDSAFEAIDLLVQHLKMNKSYIIDREWKISYVKSIFSQRKSRNNAINNAGSLLERTSVLESKSAGKEESEYKASSVGEEGWSNDW
eukprot:jgi/Antlo1/400/888